MPTLTPTGLGSATPAAPNARPNQPKASIPPAPNAPQLSPDELAIRRREALSQTLDDLFNKVITTLTEAFDKLKTLLLEVLTPAKVAKKVL